MGYADDIPILIPEDVENIMSFLMNRAFKIAEEWCSRTGLSVNPQKTGLVLFTGKHKVKTFALLSVG